MFGVVQMAHGGYAIETNFQCFKYIPPVDSFGIAPFGASDRCLRKRVPGMSSKNVPVLSSLWNPNMFLGQVLWYLGMFLGCPKEMLVLSPNFLIVYYEPLPLTRRKNSRSANQETF